VTTVFEEFGTGTAVFECGAMGWQLTFFVTR
jgi:hypothetical protein